MTLDQQLRWLSNQISLEAKGLPNAGETDHLSLEPMRELLTLLGAPHLDAPAVHLTGTNGKGSTAHLISLLLREHGLRVGTYSSPHISSINERIQLDAMPITDDDFADALATVRVAAEQMDTKLSWFELMTAAAFRAFSDAAVDVMVIEVGMLGRYDATNVIDATVSVVTNIAKDHTDGTEGWRDRVAAEKAGIVKPGSTLVLGDVDEDLAHWFVDEGPGQVLRYGSQIELTTNALAVGGRVVDVRTPRDLYDAVYVPLHGEHQGVNAAMAIGAAEAFLQAPLERELLDAGMGHAMMLGRFEVLATDPLVVIDGAHNPAGAAIATETFLEAFEPYGQRMLVVGMMTEKRPAEMLEALDAASYEVVICCQPDWPRALPSEELARVAREMGIEPEVVGDPADAIDLAMGLSGEGDAILVAGSLYVAGAVRDRLTR